MEHSTILFSLLALLMALPFVFGTFSVGRDLKGETTSLYALDETNATAAGSGDNTAAPGVNIDTRTLADPASVVFEVWARATLAAAATLTITGKVEHSVTGSGDWADLVTASSLLVLTGGSGGTTEKGVARLGADLRQANRYIRVNVTPDLSAGSTDTATLTAVAVFGGLARS